MAKDRDTARRAARFKANLDDAVRHAALKPARITTEDLGWLGVGIVERWNAKADEIDATFGKGFFGLRMEPAPIFCKLPRPPRHSKRDERGPAVKPAFRFVSVNPGGYARSVLLFLSASNPDDETIGWMLDVLDMVPLPENRIIRAAKAKNGLWDRRLRKDRQTSRIKGAMRDFENECEALERLAIRRGGFI